MKFLFLISLFCILVAATRASEESGYFKDPKYPGKCVVDDIILSPGEEGNKPCFRVLCGSNGFATIQRCGSQAAGPGYKLGEFTNPKAPYPDCCERNVVPE